jgi:hypothetical protein
MSAQRLGTGRGTQRGAGSASTRGDGVSSTSSRSTLDMPSIMQ